MTAVSATTPPATAICSRSFGNVKCFQGTLTARIWPLLLTAVLFDLLVAVALLVLWRFQILCVGRSKLVGWGFLAGGLLLVTLFALVIALRLNFWHISVWVGINAVPDKLFTFAGDSATRSSRVLDARRRNANELARSRCKRPHGPDVVIL